METHIKCEPSEELKKQLTEAGYTAGFCMAELLEQLPQFKEIDFAKCILMICPWGDGRWYVAYKVHDENEERKAVKINKSLPDALAKMWVHLKGENLL